MYKLYFLTLILHKKSQKLTILRGDIRLSILVDFLCGFLGEMDFLFITTFLTFILAVL